MITTPAPHIQTEDEVSSEDIAAVESALRHLERQDKRKKTLTSIAQWYLVLKMFKEVEIAFTICKNKGPIEQRHRGILMTLAGMGEMLLAESDNFKDTDFALISTSRASIGANIRYLREKYEQWYVEVDLAEQQRVIAKLSDEREVCLRENSQPQVQA